MSYAHPGCGALQYQACRYGESRISFRGPRKRTDVPYGLFLGGTETYGKFIADPFPDRVARAVGQTTINLGCVNAGFDVFSGDRTIMEMTRQAKVTVIQAPGAINQSNRFFTVHPRRNDRFLAALPPLLRLYPDVDFTEFAFTGHLVSALQGRSPERFAVVARSLRAEWVKRMRGLLTRAGAPTILLWLSRQAPGPDVTGEIGPDPVLVTRSMMDQVQDAADHYVEVVPDAAAWEHGGQGMACAPLDIPAAASMAGPEAHAQVARALAPVVGEYLKRR